MIALTLMLALQAGDFTREPFERHITFLASDEMKGRDNGTEEGRKAAQYVADTFRDLGLKPGCGEGYVHDFTAKMIPGGTRDFSGRNVAGLLEGDTKDEIVIVAAHHDGRGVVAEQVQNGADGNASGVAMVLELARSFSGGKRPARSILFVSFDCEEDFQLGSREFLRAGIIKASSIAAVFVFELVGGDFLPWEKDRIYALGTEHSGALADRVAEVAGKEKGLEVARGSVSLFEPLPGVARSDYGPFRARRIPFVFFTAGIPGHYHTGNDDPSVINYGKLVRAASFARRMIAATADAPTRPDYREAPPPSKEELLRLAVSLEQVEKNAEALKLDERRLASLKALREALGKGEDPDPRLLQRAMILLFAVARQAKMP